MPKASQPDAKPLPPALPTQCSPSPSSSPISIPLSKSVALDEDLGNRAADLLERYPEWYATHRKGARALIKPALDFQRACDLCRVWPDDRLAKMAAILLTTDDEWVSRTDRGFGVFASRAQWCDDRLKQWELSNGVAV